MRRVWATLAALPALWATLWAVEPPRIEKVFPLGGQRGTDVEVELSGSGLINIDSAAFDSNDLTWKKTIAAGPDKVTGVISIGSAAAPGPHILQLRGQDGNSNSVLFNAGQFPARRESEPNDSREQAQVLSGFPLEVYGELANRSETDFYAFDAGAGERLAFDLRSLEHGSNLECKMRLVDSGGKPLLFSDDRGDFDETPYLEYRFTTSGRYYVQVDQYHGPRAADPKNNTYILRISSLPKISFSSNLGGQTGATLRARLTGQDLQRIDRVFLTKARLAEHFRFTYPNTISLDLRPDPATGERVERLSGRVTGSSPDHADVEFAIPSGASTGLWRLWGGAPEGLIEGGFLEISREREVSELEVSKHDAGSGAPRQEPLVIRGALAQPKERDRFTFPVQAGKTMHFHVQSAQLGSPALDSVLELHDAKGKLLAANDDVVTGAASFGNPDSSLFYTPKEDGPIQLTIRDRLGRGGASYAYRLHAAYQRPLFQLWTLPDNVIVERSGSVEFKVRMAREEGFDKEEVEVWVEGLPAGVTAQPAKFRADQAWELGGDGLQMITPELALSIQASASLPVGTYAFQVKGAAGNEKDDPQRRVVSAQSNLLIGPLTNLFNFVRRPLPGITLTVVEPLAAKLTPKVSTLALTIGEEQAMEIALSSLPESIPIELKGLPEGVSARLATRDATRAVFRLTPTAAVPAPFRLTPAANLGTRWAAGNAVQVTVLRKNLVAGSR